MGVGCKFIIGLSVLLSLFDGTVQLTAAENLAAVNALLKNNPSLDLSTYANWTGKCSGKSVSTGTLNDVQSISLNNSPKTATGVSFQLPDIVVVTTTTTTTTKATTTTTTAKITTNKPIPQLQVQDAATLAKATTTTPTTTTALPAVGDLNNQVGLKRDPLSATAIDDDSKETPTSATKKAPNDMKKLILALLAFCAVFAYAEANCYDNWSRCTPQTSFGTGILWKSCPDYCRRCKGKSNGRCVEVHNKECSGGYQCQCSGADVGIDQNPLVVATCKLGL
ncbi:unnamed protein product, partial [Mesorhabditis spiculigera]